MSMILFNFWVKLTICGYNCTCCYSEHELARQFNKRVIVIDDHSRVKRATLKSRSCTCIWCAVWGYWRKVMKLPLTKKQKKTLLTMITRSRLKRKEHNMVAGYLIREGFRSIWSNQLWVFFDMRSCKLSCALVRLNYLLNIEKEVDSVGKTNETTVYQGRSIWPWGSLCKNNERNLIILPL